MCKTCYGGSVGKSMKALGWGVTYSRLQLRVLGFGFFQDGDVGVGVFPEGEEVLICGAGFDGIARHCVGAGKGEMCQYSNGFIEHSSAMVEDFLELVGGFVALMRRQMGFAAHKN